MEFRLLHNSLAQHQSAKVLNVTTTNRTGYHKVSRLQRSEQALLWKWRMCQFTVTASLATETEREREGTKAVPGATTAIILNLAPSLHNNVLPGWGSIVRISRPEQDANIIPNQKWHSDRLHDLFVIKYQSTLYHDLMSLVRRADLRGNKGFVCIYTPFHNISMVPLFLF